MQGANQQTVYTEEDDSIAAFLFCLDPQKAVRFLQEFGGTESYMSKDLRDRIARVTGEEYADAVFEYFQGERIPVPKAERYFSKMREKEALRLLKTGKTTNEVAVTLDLTTRSVQLFLQRADEETRKVVAEAKSSAHRERTEEKRKQKNERNIRLSELRRAGKSVEEIAKMEGMSPSEVYKATKEVGREILEKREERNNLIRKKWQDGLSVEKIVSEFGMTKENIRWIIGKGRKKRPDPKSISVPRFTSNRERDAHIRQLRNAGHSLKAVSEAIGLSVARVSQIERKAKGLSSPNKPAPAETQSSPLCNAL